LEKLPVNKILLKQASIIGYVFFNLLLWFRHVLTK
jgi:hypothetical protein